MQLIFKSNIHSYLYTYKTKSEKISTSHTAAKKARSKARHPIPYALDQGKPSKKLSFRHRWAEQEAKKELDAA